MLVDAGSLDGRVSGFWRSLWLEYDSSHHEERLFKIVDLGVGAFVKLREQGLVEGNEL